MKITENEILELKKSGKSVREIAEFSNEKYITIWKVLKKHGVDLPIKKLTKEQENNLVVDHGKGMSSGELGEKYGISQSVANDYIKRNNLTPHGNYRKKYMNENFFKTLTEDSCWVLGWFYSDGNVSKSSNMFNITAHKNDKKVLLNIGSLMEFSEESFYYGKNTNCITMYGCEPTIHSDLISLGCVPNKSLIITYPTFFIEEWQNWAFLRGCWDGDGHLSLKTEGNRPGFNCELSSGSLLFLQDVQNMIKSRLNIDTGIIERPGTNSKRLIIKGGREDILKLLDKMYENSNETNRLSRKYAIYLRMKEVIERAPDNEEINRDRLKQGFFKSPDGKIYDVRGITQFAKEVNVPCAIFFNLLKPRKYKTKPGKYGWFKPTEGELADAQRENKIILKQY